MSAKKGVGNVSVPEFFEEARLIELIDQLDRRHFYYCQEIESLKKSSASGSGGLRAIFRQARLYDLQKRLLPALQADLAALHAQKSGGIF